MKAKASRDLSTAGCMSSKITIEINPENDIMDGLRFDSGEDPLLNKLQLNSWKHRLEDKPVFKRGPVGDSKPAVLAAHLIECLIDDHIGLVAATPSMMQDGKVCQKLRARNHTLSQFVNTNLSPILGVGKD
ncbi:hypothetical protein GUJ93_ZPchr0002g24238 [Zizania palustris]|uniref:Uncharacterized protein n=1 Tax=Zizania palustris TaxID=103762 RepID=A0A8J5V546_ZIZPA|nr:hypothetical protein GUJ93_ZPchr0002g24238 [Zizania palustris]